MLPRLIWIFLLSLITCANAFCGPDDDEDECEQCQVCFETADLRQVCACLHNICRSCLQELVNHSPDHVSTVPCPNCRRHWEINELIDRCQLQRPVRERLQIRLHVRWESPEAGAAVDTALGRYSDNLRQHEVAYNLDLTSTERQRESETLRRLRLQEESNRQNATMTATALSNIPRVLHRSQ